MAHPIHTRRQAAELGLLKYFTGRPCKRGHSGWRYTKTGGCIHCNNVYSNRYNEILAAKAQRKVIVKFSVDSRDAARVTEWVNAVIKAREIQNAAEPERKVASPFQHFIDRIKGPHDA